MKYYIVLFATLSVLLSCSSNNERNNVSIQATSLSGFNVNNFAELVKKTKDPKDIESQINTPDNDVNNLDLDNDGKVDFLKVTETKDQIQVIDDVSDSKSTVIATLTISRNNDRADVNIQGDPSYCGPSYHYHSSFGIGEFLLLSYLFAPHPYYVPMYHYGYYPSYYRPYHTTTYRNVTRTTTNVGSSRSPQSNRSSLGNPTKSQRSFSTRDNTRSINSSGFGSSSSRSSGFGSGRIRSSFGSGRSSFGRRR